VIAELHHRYARHDSPRRQALIPISRSRGSSGALVRPRAPSSAGGYPDLAQPWRARYCPKLTRSSVANVRLPPRWRSGAGWAKTRARRLGKSQAGANAIRSKGVRRGQAMTVLRSRTRELARKLPPSSRCPEEVLPVSELTTPHASGHMNAPEHAEGTDLHVWLQSRCVT